MDFDKCKTNCSDCSVVADSFVVSQQYFVCQRFVGTVFVLLEFSIAIGNLQFI